MSGSRDEFWKELMGDDFKVDPSDGEPKPHSSPEVPAPDKPGLEASTEDTDIPAPDETMETQGPGFKIEYVSRSGRPTEETPPAEPRPPVAPAPSAPQGPAAQTPHQIPAQRTPPASSERPAQHTPPAPTQRPAQTSPPEQPARHFEPVRRQEYDGPAASSRSERRGRTKEDSFEVEFDFDAEYPDVNEKALRRGRTRRTGLLSGLLLFLFVICVSVVLACLGWKWATDVLGFDGTDEVVEVTLPKSIFTEEQVEEENDEGEMVMTTVLRADIDAVADELYSKGLISHKWLFKLFAKISDADTKVQAGTYTLNMNYDYRAIVHGMNPRSGKRSTVMLTIPEGYTITQIVALMEENKVCQAEDLLDSLANTDFDYDFLKDADVPPLGDPKRLEGYLFPDTYEFYENDDPDAVIRRFLVNFERKWAEGFDKLAEGLGYTRRQILNIASMIEKEAGSDAERDNIASVIYNRLQHPDRQGTNGLLQIDATIYYVIADTGENFSTEIDSPYNTYKYAGLPAGPIANPGIASIRAALNPASTKYYFYALGANGSHRFFQTYEQFTNFVNSDQYAG